MVRFFLMQQISRPKQDPQQAIVINGQRLCGRTTLNQKAGLAQSWL